MAFYIDEHNRVLPHSAFRGQTPDEMYFGTGDPRRFGADRSEAQEEGVERRLSQA
ncbi:MAG TPA: hypothetical protein VMO26_22110 [Vicinamibacterales bacterium]|nr:hypothetical protein [Vicinamibacterales bacterium]